MTQTDARMQTILELLRDGRSDRRIARRLGISCEEVRAAVRDLIDAAHLDDRGRAQVLAERAGIVRHDPD